MDFKVCRKETVKQPQGDIDVLQPNIIDIFIETKETNNTTFISNALILNSEKERLEQAVALNTIYQKGLDPLDLTHGIRWTEAVLEEITAVQLMQDIENAVQEVTPTVDVVFDTIQGENGNTYLSYNMRANA